MGKGFYATSAGAKAGFEEANAALGFDLARLLFEGPEAGRAGVRGGGEGRGRRSRKRQLGPADRRRGPPRRGGARGRARQPPGRHEERHAAGERALPLCPHGAGRGQARPRARRGLDRRSRHPRGAQRRRRRHPHRGGGHAPPPPAGREPGPVDRLREAARRRGGLDVRRGGAGACADRAPQAHRRRRPGALGRGPGGAGEDTRRAQGRGAPMTKGPLDGRVAIVTGGSRGIGAAIAALLAEDGAAVVVSGRDADRLQRTTQELEAQGGAILGVVADAAIRQDAERLVDAAKQRFGRVDILVNNAGVVRDGLLVRMKDEDWDRVMEVNLRGAFLMTRAATKLMIRRKSGGRVINIASTSGTMGNAGQANYSAAKAGVIGVTKAAARELAHWSILVNAVAPGLIETDMTAAIS